MSTSGYAASISHSADGNVGEKDLVAINARLNADQIAFFRNEGYLSCGALTTPLEVKEIKATLEDLFSRKAGEREGAFVDVVAGGRNPGEMTSPQIIGPANYAPSLRKTLCFRNATAIAKQLLGDEARCLFELAILKNANGGAPTPWHQDEASCDPWFEYKQVGFWIPLQDVVAESGCLHFVPKSHKGEVLEHRPVNGDPTAHSLEYIGVVPEGVEVICPLPAGGYSLHHPRILHFAGENVSGSPRLAYVMTFGVPPKPAKTSRTFPWLQQRHTAAQVRNRRWMWRGGLIVTVFRKLRRGELTDWRIAWYGVRRSVRALRKGA
jgi:hypothetical protein